MSAHRRTLPDFALTKTAHVGLLDVTRHARDSRDSHRRHGANGCFIEACDSEAYEADYPREGDGTASDF